MFQWLKFFITGGWIRAMAAKHRQAEEDHLALLARADAARKEACRLLGITDDQPGLIELVNKLCAGLEAEQEEVCQRRLDAGVTMDVPLAGRVPANCDVRKVMIDIQPGDGEGLEIFAKSNEDVENLFAKLDGEMEEERANRIIAEASADAGAKQVAEWRNVVTLIGNMIPMRINTLDDAYRLVDEVKPRITA